MEEQFRQLLTGHGPLGELVGNRIYWDEIPQGTQRPCIVMYVISSVPGYHFQGPEALMQWRVQIDCQAATTVQKWAVARAVEGLLSGFRGAVGGVQFSGIFKLLDRDKTSPDTTDNILRVRQQDYQVWTKPAA